MVVPARTRRSVEEARTAILDAAEKVVGEVGPAGLRLTAVAKRAGMAHPNLIHHFGSREGLLRALASRVVQRTTDRVVAAIADAMTVSDDERVAALTRALDAVDLNGEGRVLAWLVISGRAEGIELPDMDPLLRVVHEWRTSAVGPAEFDDTRRLVLLSSLALTGDAVTGAGLVETLGLGVGDEGRRQFRAWLAEFLIKQVV